MSSTAPATRPANAPLPYEPSFEQPEEGEQQTAQELVETMRSISEKTLEDSGHAIRSVPPRAMG